MMAPLQHALHPAGPQAAHIAQLWWLTLGICGVVFVAVLAAFFIALRRAPRANAGTPADISSLKGESRPAKRTVITAIALSIVGLLTLLVASVATDRALARMSVEGALGIQVTAHQWWWDVRYDDPEPSRVFGTANEIHIPVGRPVLISLRSDDVIHSFWVPNLHGKKDLIPGKIATMQLRADAPGRYRGQCAEFCGVQHAFMAFEVVADPPEAFERWAEAQRAAAAAPAEAAAQRGRDLFLSGSCMLCHAVQGTPANGRKGPDLTHVATRRTLAAGTLPNDREHLRQWIENPQRFKPGVNMPSHRVAADELDALVAYLGSLR